MSAKLNISLRLQEVKCSTALCRICFAFPILQLLLHISDSIRCWVTSRPDWVSTHQTALLVRITTQLLGVKAKLNLFCEIWSNFGGWSECTPWSFWVCLITSGTLPCVCVPWGEQRSLLLSHHCCSTQSYTEKSDRRKMSPRSTQSDIGRNVGARLAQLAESCKAALQDFLICEDFGGLKVRKWASLISWDIRLSP